MKKIILEEKESNILIDNVETEHIILIKKKGNDFGVAMYVNCHWYCKTIANTQDKHLHISDALKWFGANCEYYVL